MSEENLPQPHDKLAKITFSQAEYMAAALRSWLEEEQTREMDFSRMELVSGSFVDEQFQASETDLLWRIPHRGGDLLLYLLFEHQSTEDPRMALRLLRYMLRIWERHEQEHKAAGRLPIVLPLVLAQSDRPWRQQPELRALFGLTPEEEKIWGAFIPKFRFRLVELAKIPFEQLAGPPMMVLTLRVLKAEPLHEVLSDMVLDEGLFAELTRDQARQIARYLFGIEHVDKEELRRIIAGRPKIRERVMTLAQQFHKEGKEEGLQEGRSEGRSEGELFGSIRTLESVLERPQTPVEVLEKRSLAELQQMLEDLRGQVTRRG